MSFGLKILNEGATYKGFGLVVARMHSLYKGSSMIRRRDVDTFLNSGGGHNLPHWLVLIGLTDLQNSGPPGSYTSASEKFFV